MTNNDVLDKIRTEVLTERVIKVLNFINKDINENKLLSRYKIKCPVEITDPDSLKKPKAFFRTAVDPSEIGAAIDDRNLLYKLSESNNESDKKQIKNFYKNNDTHNLGGLVINGHRIPGFLRRRSIGYGNFRYWHLCKCNSADLEKVDEIIKEKYSGYNLSLAKNNSEIHINIKKNEN